MPKKQLSYAQEQYYARGPAERTTFKHCQTAKCEASFPDHKWGVMRAQREGWFFGKDGSIYCPKHLPHWVKGWRERAYRKRQAQK